MKAPLPPNEAQRLETLLGYDILDTAREQVFDNLTLLAAHICQTPISLVSFVDERRQWFKSRVGLEALETSRDLAFCAYTILKPDEVLEVRDAQLDPRFADNPLVTGDPNIRFYAGVPLVAFDGHALGTLCVIDRIPRTLSTEQRTALRALAQAAVTQLDLHRVLAAQRCAEQKLLHTKEELESANASLEQKVAMRTSELLQEIEERKQLLATAVESRRALLGILEDQQRAEAELSQSEAHFRTIFEQATDGILISDANANILDANNTICQLLGYSREAILKLNVANLVVADESPRLGPEISRLKDSGIVRTEWRLRRQDGSILFGEVTSKQLPDGRSQGFIRDITQEKKAQQALRENEKLEEQYRLVQEANRLKSEFLANMSHELRTPLNAIIGFSELMHDGKVGAVAPDHKEYLGDILSSAKHLLQLINDVLDLAKVESGKMVFFPEPVNLSRIIGEVRNVLRALMSLKRIEVAIEVDAALDEVVADASKLKQVLYNYLSNALKFSPEGGRVTVRAMLEGDTHYRIEVEDSGIGIKHADLARLFVEFQQLDTSTAKKHQGTGLGLALTRRIVEAQYGRVGVTSVVGKGSVFYAVLPRTPLSAPASAQILMVEAGKKISPVRKRSTTQGGRRGK